MEPTKTPVPREAIDAYNLYIHGHIDRRSFMDRVKKVAISSAAAAAIVDQLMPNYAAAQQVSPTDSRIKGEYATVPSPQGNGSIKGYLVRPANAGTNRLPAILVVHENRGLNPHIEDIARRLALENFMAFAPDGLTSVGGYPGDDEKGGAMFGKVDRAKMGEDLFAAAVWVKGRPDSSGRLGVTGFCFGGGIANSLAVRMGADLQAAVPYYGGAPPAADVAKIKAAVLVHHGGEDKRLVDAYPEY
jgi:carboxymethylenebutenolidase